MRHFVFRNTKHVESECAHYGIEQQDKAGWQLPVRQETIFLYPQNRQNVGDSIAICELKEQIRQKRFIRNTSESAGAFPHFAEYPDNFPITRSRTECPFKQPLSDGS